MGKIKLTWFDWELEAIDNWWCDSVDDPAVSQDYFNDYFNREVVPGLLHKQVSTVGVAEEIDPGRFEIKLEEVKRMVANSKYNFSKTILPSVINMNGNHRSEWQDKDNEAMLQRIFADMFVDGKPKALAAKDGFAQHVAENSKVFSFSRYVKAAEIVVPEWISAYVTTVEGFVQEAENRRTFISWRPADVLGMSHKISGSCYRAGGEYCTAPLLVNSSDYAYVAYTTRKEPAASGARFRVKTSRLFGFDLPNMVVTGRVYKHNFIQMVVNLLMAETSDNNGKYLELKQSSEETFGVSPFYVLENASSSLFYSGDWEASNLTYLFVPEQSGKIESGFAYFSQMKLLEKDINSLNFYSQYEETVINIFDDVDFRSDLSMR